VASSDFGPYFKNRTLTRSALIKPQGEKGKTQSGHPQQVRKGEEVAREITAERSNKTGQEDSCPRCTFKYGGRVL